jgi:transcriptional regulator with XRE-family HTH domain
MAKPQAQQEARPHPRSIEAIADRLLRTRLALGLNQTELCARAGLAKNTYNQWECGHGRPGLDYAIQLCEAFDLTLDWIYLGHDGCLRGHLLDRLRDPI